MEQKEKEVIAGYTVQTSLWIGDKRLIYARSDNPQEPHPYMKCICTQNGLLTEYTEALCSDRYEEVMKRFAEDIRTEAVRLEAEKSAKGDAVAPCFGKDDVEPAPYDRSIKGKVVALKPDALDDSYAGGRKGVLPSEQHHDAGADEHDRREPYQRDAPPAGHHPRPD